MTGTPTRLCLKPVLTTLTPLYSTISDGRTAIRDVMVTNTTAADIRVSLYIGAASTDNAFGWSNTAIPAYSSAQFNGYQIMNIGETLNAIASAVGVTVCISGDERI